MENSIKNVKQYCVPITVKTQLYLPYIIRGLKLWVFAFLYFALSAVGASGKWLGKLI